MKKTIGIVTELIEPTIEALGMQLWGIEHVTQGKYSLLRIYIDKDDGILIEDCAEVSRHVGALLDVEDPIPGEYTLEVSSPGVDRPLFKPEQFSQFAGEEVKIRLKVAREGRRKFRGVIDRVEDGNIFLVCEDNEIEIPHVDIEKAQLVYQHAE